ncbi:MAG TPA: methyltransferase domain-containing protein [Actinobacteria bacterium]|nr:methyltransferase domain-containing protein [Actinomycetes bacterium]HEX21558.1 methyltransferase domain-containing protein [Actinomycetota bacterium]
MGFFSSSLDYTEKHWYTPGGWQEMLLAGSAYRLGIFKILADKPLTANELADNINTDERATDILLNALTAAGYLTIKDSRFSLTDAAVTQLIDENHPNFIGFSISHSLRLAERWLTLPEVLVSGQPVAGDRFSETPEGFIKAMDVYAKKTAAQAVEYCLSQNPQAKKVLDIGGATGTVSRLFAQRGLDSTLFDIPAVIELDQESLGDNPNIELVTGDFNKSLPSGAFDIVYLGNITHIYSEEKNAALFKKIYKILNPGGIIVILDFVRGLSPSAPLFAVNMLVNTHEGGTWTLDEFSGWLKAAGFGGIDYIDVKERDQQLIAGKK